MTTCASEYHHQEDSQPFHTFVNITLQQPAKVGSAFCASCRLALLGDALPASMVTRETALPSGMPGLGKSCGDSANTLVNTESHRLFSLSGMADFFFFTRLSSSDHTCGIQARKLTSLQKRFLGVGGIQHLQRQSYFPSRNIIP